MKKYLIILLVLIAGCAKQPVYKASRAPSLILQDINIGTVANDHTGDPLRTMGTKINTNNTALRNFAATLLTATEINALLAVKASLASPQFTGVPRIATDTIAVTADIDSLAGLVIADSLQTLRDSADVADDYYYLKTSGEALEAQIANLEGAGGGYSKYKIQFVVGASGFPADGDSTVTHTTWSGKEVELYRDGLSQRYNSTATNTVDGFRLNNTTGAITVKPAFSTGEIIKIDAYNPVTVEWLTLSGTESTLLSGLRGFWKLDETTGTAVNDATGVYNGTTTATVGTVGHFGYAETFDGTTDFVDLGTTVGDVGTNDFALTARIYVTAWPSTYDCAGVAGNWGSYPYFYMGVYGDHRIKGVVNFAGSNIEIFSNSAINLNTWYDIALVADRSGNMTLYVDGVAQTDVADISASSAVSITNNNTFAIGRVGNSLSGHWFTGIIDDVGLWIKALSSGEITEYGTKTHPF